MSSTDGQCLVLIGEGEKRRQMINMRSQICAFTIQPTTYNRASNVDKQSGVQLVMKEV